MSNPWDDFSDKNGKKDKVSDIDKNKSMSDTFFDQKKDKKSFIKKEIKNNNDKTLFKKFFDTFLENQIDFNKNADSKDNFLKIYNFNNFKLFCIVIFGIFVLWLMSGFYTVKQEESAIVMRFGKYVRDEKSGLHYHAPYPIEEVIKEKTTRVRIIKIGSDDNNKDNKLGEGWALTGDENIVNLELNVQWKIDNLKKFIFGVRDKEQTIYDATQSAIREVISRRKLADILTSGRSEIEEETKKLLQEMLDSYNIGVNIIVVQMLKIDPPSQVIDSFRDVQTARVDKESEINKAYKYKNDILPKVRGEAGKIIEDANGYAISIINQAKGDAIRFNEVYEQYKNAPSITKNRMYLETMEDILDKNQFTIVDENVKNIFLDTNNKVYNKIVSSSIENNDE